MKELVQDVQLESKDILISVLKDTIEDKNKVVKRLQILLFTVTVLSLCLLSLQHFYNDWSFKSFLSQYDIENSVNETIDLKNDVNADNAKNHNINATIEDIKNIVNPKSRK